MSAVAGGRFRMMQAYDDGICWRSGRLAANCPDCDASAEVFCDEHAGDLRLITSYRLAWRRLAEGGQT